MTKLTAWMEMGARFVAVLATGLSLGACTYLFDSDYDMDAPPPPQRTIQGEARAPNLSSVPPRPDATTTPEQRRAIQQGLIADRENARYTDETLRGRPATPAPAAAPPRAAAPASAPTPAATAPEPAMPPVAAPAAAPNRPAAVPPPIPAAQRQPATPMPPSAQVATAPAPSSAAERRIPSIVQDSPPPAVSSAPSPVAQGSPMAAPAPMPAAAAAPARPMTLAEVFQQQVAVAHRDTVVGLPGSAPAAATPPPPAAAAPAAAPQQMALAGGAGMSAPAMVPVQPVATAAQPTAVPARGRVGLVPFGASTSGVDPGAVPFLRQVAEQARASAARVRVVGQSPVASNASANDKLLAFSRASEQAESVAAELVRQGLPAGAVMIEARSGAGAASGAEIFLEN